MTTNQPDASRIRISSGSAVLVSFLNLLLVPLLSTGITHLSPQISYPLLLAFGIIVLTVAAWLYLPRLGGALQIAIGAVIAAVALVPRAGHFVWPRGAYELALELLLLVPLVAAILAAVVSAKGRNVR